LDKKICLDTDTVIGILNNEERAVSIINFIEEFEIFISVITLFELLLRETDLEEIEIFRRKVNVLDFDEESSRKSSDIHKELKRKGKIIEFRDVFIAAICIVNNCELVTFNKKHFENIKELKLV
tara:strand:- start:5123 stop:5494 length:372 start_codon:yes stop_codon:yes gene_type:complete